MVSGRALIVCAALAAAGGCTPNEPDPLRVKYDGKVAEALAALATDCHPIGVAKDQPIAKATDFKCVAPDAELTVHLDRSRTLRAVAIQLLATTTDEARTRLDAAMTPFLDVHHRTNIFLHLDDPVPGGINPIPQLQLEDRLYQIASEPADGELRRYIVRVRID